MEYTSTRNDALRVSASEAILKGLAPDGGLFVPVEFPQVKPEEFYGLTYPQTAEKVLRLFLTDYDPDFLKRAVEEAYGAGCFSGKADFLARVEEKLWSLELWHGPTCAFKDYALQLMPKLLVEAKRNLGDTGTTKILVATSGDTGKAALAGYAGLPGIRIAVFYPNAGTSEVQRLQMATQEGGNVAVYAVEGNFDDTQTGVKHVFADTALARQLGQKNERLSSANSINWGRLVPQIVYYFYSYAQLVAQNGIAAGDAVDYCVPTGNFGDILAGYYAKRMGLPVGRLICASNQNNVLTELLETGRYDVRRPFYKTESPSMDILVSSNLERLLYHTTQDAGAVALWMQQLAQDGVYTLPENVLAKIQETFFGACADDAQGRAEIRARFAQNGYLCDTHTAVAFCAARTAISSEDPCVVLSTASPYKFPCAVLGALGEERTADEFDAMRRLTEKTGVPVPESLASLREKEIRFTQVIDKNEMPEIALLL
ncbi:MAG: threonine synthase [Subdoligranulum sp.]|nr:threonine synthase [Subdoligranulum sp.]